MVSRPLTFIGPVLAAVSAGLSALAEAVQRGRVDIGADRLLHKVKPEDVKPVVGMAAEAMEAWLEASGITSGPLFRRINKAGRLGQDALTGTAIRDIVKARCSLAGVGDDFSAHSLRSGCVTEAVGKTCRCRKPWP